VTLWHLVFLTVVHWHMILPNANYLASAKVHSKWRATAANYTLRLGFSALDRLEPRAVAIRTVRFTGSREPSRGRDLLSAARSAACGRLLSACRRALAHLEKLLILSSSVADSKRVSRS
jgi:hypothetical protein